MGSGATWAGGPGSGATADCVPSAPQRLKYAATVSALGREEEFCLCQEDIMTEEKEMNVCLTEWKERRGGGGQMERKHIWDSGSERGFKDSSANRLPFVV